MNDPANTREAACPEMLGSDFFQSLREDTIRENAGVTHEEFVAGLKNRTMGFKCLFGEPCQLLRGPRAVAFAILVVLYKFVPFILVPIWAYHERNWWLLLGAIVSRYATRTAPWFMPGHESVSFWSGKRDSAGALLVVLVAALWLTNGIHNYLTFFSLCVLWGFLFFHMAEEAQRAYALQFLIESPELFYASAENGTIKIVRRPSDSSPIPPASGPPSHPASGTP